jgi:hypothetical protein
MHGVRRQQGEPVRFDEIRLEISTLAFKRSAHRPHMEVRVASIKDQHAGNGLWTNFKGAIKGMVANQFIPPVRIEQIGNDAVINFAQALYDGKREFTFPVAKNLIGERAVDALP